MADSTITEVLIDTFPDVFGEPDSIPPQIDLPPSTACIEYRQIERPFGRYTMTTTKRIIVSTPSPKGTN